MTEHGCRPQLAPRRARRCSSLGHRAPSPCASKTHRVQALLSSYFLHVQDGEMTCTRGVVHLVPELGVKSTGLAKVLILMMFNRSVKDRLKVSIRRNWAHRRRHKQVLSPGVVLGHRRASEDLKKERGRKRNGGRASAPPPDQILLRCWDTDEEAKAWHTVCWISIGEVCTDRVRSRTITSAAIWRTSHKASLDRIRNTVTIGICGRNTEARCTTSAVGLARRTRSSRARNTTRRTGVEAWCLADTCNAANRGCGIATRAISAGICSRQADTNITWIWIASRAISRSVVAQVGQETGTLRFKRLAVGCCRTGAINGDTG